MGEVDQARGLFLAEAADDVFRSAVPDLAPWSVRTLLAGSACGPSTCCGPPTPSPGAPRAALALLQARGVNLLVVLDEAAT